MVQTGAPVILSTAMIRWAGTAVSPQPVVTPEIIIKSSKIVGKLVRPPYVESMPYCSSIDFSQTIFPVLPSMHCSVHPAPSM